MQDARRAALAIAAGLLFLTPTAGWSAADPSDGPDWRRDEGFNRAQANIEAWLVECPEGERAVAAWRRSIESAPRASRLAEPLRQIALEHGERVVSLVADPPAEPPEWLASIGPAGASLRLAIAEGFASRGEYDACLVWSEGLADEVIFSPALLHYLRAIASRQTISDESAAEELKRFDEVTDQPNESLGPARAWVVTALRRELDKESKPLPTVVRRMRDVERRLALSQPGEETVERQQKILDVIDELLEELEEQRKQQQAAQAGGAGDSSPNNPAEESRPSELKGPGEVDRKRLVAGDAWGALPPAERERLTQSITRDFPPHYRGLVEDYFKTLAAEADATAPPTSDR